MEREQVAQLLYLLREKRISTQRLAISDLESYWREVGATSLDLSESLEYLDKLSSKGVGVISILDLRFQSLNLNLSTINLLFYVGNLSLLDRPNKVGIVGSRRATSSSIQNTEKIATLLGANKYIIVSGLAMGVDAAAHRGAVQVSSNSTIAVLGNPLPGIAPKQNSALARKIVQKGGLIISQFMPGQVVQKSNFLIRNKLIADLSSSLIVPQASIRSGSLSTAKAMQQLARDVYVLPGAFGEEAFAGSNLLISQGCKILFSTQNLIDSLKLKQNIKRAVSEIHQYILSSPGTSLEQLLCDYNSKQVFSEILRLKTLHLIKELPGSRFVPVG